MLNPSIAFNTSHALIFMDEMLLIMHPVNSTVQANKRLQLKNLNKYPSLNFIGNLLLVPHIGTQ